MFGVPFPVNLRVVRALFIRGTRCSSNQTSQPNDCEGPLLPESLDPHPMVNTPSLAVGLEVFRASKQGLCVRIRGVQASACVFRHFFIRTPA